MQAQGENSEDYAVSVGPFQVIPPVVSAVPAPMQPPLAIPSSPTRRSEKRPLPQLVCWLWLVGPSLVLALSWLMSVGDGRQVELLAGHPLPEICTLHASLGIDCPGCGLTRSFIHLADGNPRAAWQLNPIGILLFVYLLAQLPLAALHLQVSLAQHKVLPPAIAQWTRWNEHLLVGIMAGLLLQWIARLATGDLFG